MAVPFGFSVGDSIAAIGVFKDTIKALGDTQGASADYQELNRALGSLQDGLTSIQSLTLDDSQRDHFDVISKVVKDSQRCIDGFLDQTSKFKSLERSNSNKWSLGTFKRNCRKIEWALCKKDDIVKFRSEVGQQVNAIQILLTSFSV
jgi:hypothetical protein